MPSYSPLNTLLAVDMAGSALRRARTLQGYTPFGYAPGRRGETAFAGQLRESGLYLLGNGYRAYLPALGRFTLPDGVSPFGRGGLNAYVYCGGDPVNRLDSKGASWAMLGKVWSKSVSVKQVHSALELTYAGGGQGRVLRFATSEVADATQMYTALGAQLSNSEGSLGVMIHNAEQVKASTKVYQAIPSSSLRDPSLFERAIERHLEPMWGGYMPIKPVTMGDWPTLPGSLDVENPAVRRTVLSYLYYQELADPRIVQARGRVEPWSIARF